MRHIDTLIYASWVIPVEPDDRVLEQHALAIHQGEILDILPISQAVHTYSARITHRLSGHVLIPGLINAHTHAAMTLLRGYGSDKPLMQWLNDYIWPAEQTWVDEQFVADGSRLAIAEMIRSGITCFNDMYFYPEAVADVALELGMRACLGMIILDFPSNWAKDPDAYLLRAEDLQKKYADQNLLSYIYAPHAPYSVSDAPLSKVVSLAQEKNLRIHMHIHETQDEIQQGIKDHQKRPLQRLDALGLLNDRLLAVHMTQLTDTEIQRIAETGVHVVHCPESNMKLASGFCPVSQLLKAGVNVALGTDGAASNDDLDILGEMRSAAFLAKAISGDASQVPAAQALRMATINGAKALGLEAITGSLQAGKAADITAIDMSALSTQPVYNPLTQLVYSASRDQVSDVWIAGRHVLKSKNFTTLDMQALNSKIAHWRHKITEKTHND